MGCDERMYLRYTTVRKDGKVHRYWRLVRSVRVGRRVIQQTVAQLGELDARGRLQARALARQLIGTPEQAGLFDDGQQDMTVPVRLKGVRVERSRQFGDVYLALALWRGTRPGRSVREAAAVGQGSGAVGEDGGGAGGGAAVRAVERAAHRRGLVPAHGAVRSAAARWRSGQQGSAVSRARSAAGAQGRAGGASVAALRRAVRGRQRGAAVRRDQHLLRGRGRGQRAGPARLQPRSPARLQAGLHRPGGDLRRLPAGLRGVRRQHPRQPHRADHRRHDGSPSRRGRPRVDRRSRHVERGEPGVAAPDRAALHHRRAQGRAAQVRRRARGGGRLAGDPRRHRGQAGAPGPTPARRRSCAARPTGATKSRPCTTSSAIASRRRWPSLPRASSSSTQAAETPPRSIARSAASCSATSARPHASRSRCRPPIARPACACTSSTTRRSTTGPPCRKAPTCCAPTSPTGATSSCGAPTSSSPRPRPPSASRRTSCSVRPIWHQRADRVQAHILVCFLAFVLWKCLEMWQQRAGLGNSPRTVLEELARIQSHDVVLPTATHGEIRLRCVTQPDAASGRLARSPRHRPAQAHARRPRRLPLALTA